MLKQSFKFRLVPVLLVGLSLFSSGQFVRADDRPEVRREVHHEEVRRDVHQDIHRDKRYYHNGRWYRHGWLGVGVPVTLSAGVYVDGLPSAYTTVVVRGNSYYYGDNTYFQPLPEGGYVVVTP